MATIKKGILGGVSGKVGNVVGGSLNGVHYLRSLPSRVRQANSIAQLAQRSRFRTMVQFLKPLKELIGLGFRAEAGKMNAFNAAVSYNLREAVAGDAETGFGVDHAKVLLTQGSRPGLTELIMESQEKAVIALQWADNSGMRGAEADDILFLAVYHENSGHALVELNLALRSSSAAQLQLPIEWSGSDVHVYAGFLARSVMLGVVKSNLISRSQYAGSLTLA